MITKPDPTKNRTVPAHGNYWAGEQALRFAAALDNPLIEHEDHPNVQMWTLRQLCYLMLSIKLGHNMRDVLCDKTLRLIATLLGMVTFGKVIFPPSWYHLKKVMGVKDAHEYERCACPTGKCCFPSSHGPLGTYMHICATYIHALRMCIY